MHQIAVVQANGGDVALGGGIDNAGGAGANAQTIDHLSEVGDHLIDGVGTVFDGGHDQVAGGLQGGSADRFVARADHHLVNTAGASFASFAKTSLHAGAVLEFKGHMFHDVSRPSAFGQSLQETAAFTDAATMLNEARKHFLKAMIEARQGVGGAIFQISDINPSFNDGSIRPDVGTLEVGHLQKFDFFRTHFRMPDDSERWHGAIRVRGYNGRPVAALAMIVW